mmetsp:Transcript_18451/g.35162  ORF Transcript_18451/g.35162 Transcript_18451/m.35162 type:complete len:315 (+) Transcript_18451:127-1071(+)
MTSTTTLHHNERGERERWPVLVYRLKSKGWEVYADPDLEAAAATTSASDSSKKNNANQTKTAAAEELTAAPRTGCIEVRKMRLRIRLFEQNVPWNPNPRRQQAGESQDRRGNSDDVGPSPENTEKSAGSINHRHKAENNDYDPEIPGSDGWNNNALVVRRQNTLLISTRRGMGAIVFQFKSNQDCIEFCDRLVYLNKDYFSKPCNDSERLDVVSHKRTAEDKCQVVNGMTQNELYCKELREQKRRRYEILGDETIGDPVTRTAEESSRFRRKDELLSYVVRLAHDENFRGFVDELERSIQLAPDCSGIHAAFGN